MKTINYNKKLEEFASLLFMAGRKRKTEPSKHLKVVEQQLIKYHKRKRKNPNRKIK